MERAVVLLTREAKVRGRIRIKYVPGLCVFVVVVVVVVVLSNSPSRWPLSVYHARSDGWRGRRKDAGLPGTRHGLRSLGAWDCQHADWVPGS